MSTNSIFGWTVVEQVVQVTYGLQALEAGGGAFKSDAVFVGEKNGRIAGAELSNFNGIVTVELFVGI